MYNRFFASPKITDCTRHFDSSTLSALRTIKYHGLSRERSSTGLCDADIVITTYHTLAAEIANSNNLVNDIEWHRLVLDEGTWLSL
jgi:SWI/SNF-related matrix-associated actin-dependent regulator of chromatin subfamily A3